MKTENVEAKSWIPTENILGSVNSVALTNHTHIMWYALFKDAIPFIVMKS